MIPLFCFFTKFKIIRYVVSGGTAAVIHLSILYILTKFYDVWYLYATSAAFIAAFSVGFIMQKFWTFENKNLSNVHKQGAVYFAVSIINFFLNGFFMYLLHDLFDMHVLFAQICTSTLLAVEGFIAYSIIFKNEN